MNIDMFFCKPLGTHDEMYTPVTLYAPTKPNNNTLSINIGSVVVAHFEYENEQGVKETRTASYKVSAPVSGFYMNDNDVFFTVAKRINEVMVKIDYSSTAAVPIDYSSNEDSPPGIDEDNANIPDNDANNNT